jgi:cytochrome c556
MRKFVIGLTVVALGGCLSANDTPPDNPQAVIAERVQIMKGFGGAMGAANAFVQGKGTSQAAHAKLGPARAAGERLVHLFPRGTALGDKGADKSRALSTIYQNRADFEAKLGAALSALDTLDGTLVRDDKAGATAAFNGARAACASCHNKYRAADE